MEAQLDRILFEEYIHRHHNTIIARYISNVSDVRYLYEESDIITGLIFLVSRTMAWASSEVRDTDEERVEEEQDTAGKVAQLSII